MILPLSLALCFLPFVLADFISIPLKFDDNGRYLLNLNTSTGSSQQSFQMALSTSISNVVLQGTNCPSCIGGPGYNLSASSTATTFPNGPASVQFVGGSISGIPILEDCGLLENNGTLWSYKNQTIIVANQSSVPFSSRASGVFGFGVNQSNNNLMNTVYERWFSSHPSATNFTFGMALNPPNQNSTDAGVLHWTGLDQSAYTGDIAWVNSTPPASSSSPSSWFVEMDALAFSSSNILVTGGPCMTIVDPVYPNISLPQNLARQIHSAIPGAVLQSSSNLEYWQVPCSTEANFNVTFGGSTFTMDQTNLIANADGSCFSTIVGLANTTQTEICILGSSFSSVVYLIILISQLSQLTLGLATRPPSNPVSGMSVVIAAGIAVSVIMGVVLFAVGIYLAIRKHRSRRSQHISLQSPSSFAATSTPGPPFSANSYQTEFSPQPDTTDRSQSRYLPSDIIPLLTTNRPVTVSIQRNPMNLGHSVNSASSSGSSNPHSPPLDLISSPRQPDFSIDPYVLPRTPPRLTAMDEVRRAFDDRRRRERTPYGSMVNDPGDNRSEASVTVVPELPELPEPHDPKD